MVKERKGKVATMKSPDGASTLLVGEIAALLLVQEITRSNIKTWPPPPGLQIRVDLKMVKGSWQQ